jgi:hypothetical protein
MFLNVLTHDPNGGEIVSEGGTKGSSQGKMLRRKEVEGEMFRKKI